MLRSLRNNSSSYEVIYGNQSLEVSRLWGNNLQPW